MHLRDLIEPGDIVIGLHAADIGTAAAQLLRATLPRRGYAPSDVERLVGAVLEREREAPTLCGAIAIPHARDPQLPAFVAAIGVNESGVVEGSPAPKVLIVFISPEAKRAEHLALLASVARLGRDDAAVASLAAAISAEDVARHIGALGS
ncbi:MAG TPA: PTS sugar transporter subunit IIA [Thermoanaerobaculia bacterium]|nr:PTS sugar transporter subunit IIA [Thermoanaerobaculia bacterium]